MTTSGTSNVGIRTTRLEQHLIFLRQTYIRRPIHIHMYRPYYSTKSDHPRYHRILRYYNFVDHWFDWL